MTTRILAAANWTARYLLALTFATAAAYAAQALMGYDYTLADAVVACTVPAALVMPSRR
jgi:hypothetical protein